MTCAHPSVDAEGRDVEDELDGVTHEHTAGLEHAIPDEAVVRALELSTQRERDPLTVAVDDGAAHLSVEQDRSGDALDGELSGEREMPAVAVELDLRGVEGDLRVALDVEEVGRAQMGVSLRVKGLEAFDVDRSDDRRVVTVDDRTVEVAKPSLDGLNHHVLDAELDRRMRRVDRPRTTR